MNKLQQTYQKLLKEFGPQGWWPLSKGKPETKHHNGVPRNNGDRFEIIVGAILTQNTAWTNVEKAIYNLNAAKTLNRSSILKILHKKLAPLIKPAGYYNQKAERLKIVAGFFSDKKIKEILKEKNIEKLRKELLAVKGIGPETCDSILLYAFDKPVFVIDAYTRRIFSRLKFLKEKDSYDDWQRLFMKNLKPDAKMFKEYHALIVGLAKRSCKVKQECVRCSLKEYCDSDD